MVTAVDADIDVCYKSLAVTHDTTIPVDMTLRTYLLLGEQGLRIGLRGLPIYFTAPGYQT